MQSLAALVLVVWAGIATPGIAAAQEQTVGYRVLATNKTSTMHKEMQEAGDAGFECPRRSPLRGEKQAGMRPPSH